MIRIRKNAGSSTLGLMSPRTRIHHINPDSCVFAMHRFDKVGRVARVGDLAVLAVDKSACLFYYVAHQAAHVDA